MEEMTLLRESEAGYLSRRVVDAVLYTLCPSPSVKPRILDRYVKVIPLRPTFDKQLLIISLPGMMFLRKSPADKPLFYRHPLACALGSGDVSEPDNPRSKRAEESSSGYSVDAMAEDAENTIFAPLFSS